MSNDHVAAPFAGILKQHLQGQRVKPRTNRDRFDALSVVHAELEAAGVSIDIAQLDWAVKEVEQRLYEKSLDRQYDYERSRTLRCSDCGDVVESSHHACGRGNGHILQVSK